MLLLVMALAMSMRAATAQPSLDVFAEAGKAYDAGDFAGAARRYGQLLDRNESAPELFYNLGNALFKQGRNGEAVLAYRRAWYAKPRDADIRANLRLAQQESAATQPEFPFWIRPLWYLSAAEWRHVAIVGYWLSAAALIAFLASGRRWLWARRVAVLAATIAVLGAAGLGAWAWLYARPEVVVLNGTQQALYAPMEGATPHFAMPEGSIARMGERSGTWLEVRAGDRSGWILSTQVAEVLAPPRAGLPSS
jgi:tetratricopeptide (TPR) repeat protein